MKRISKKRGKTTDFIGSFAPTGIDVYITYSRFLETANTAGKSRDQSTAEDAEYKVDVTVSTGTVTKPFPDAIFWYAR